MSNTFIDKAYAVVPEFENRISRFDKKWRIAQYTEHSIYDYKLKIALNKASLDHTITIHALRHSAATHLLENGENILNVQKRLGHARITTTLIYFHIADKEEVIP